MSTYSMAALLRVKAATTPGRPSLRRVLSWFDLTVYGVASTIGGGIYSLVSAGALAAGPAIVLSFLLCATACALTALVYAELVARVSGSPYSVAYASMGEAMAWTLGWLMTLEYGIASAGTARSYADYQVDVFRSFNVSVPAAVNELQVGPLTLSPLAAALVLVLTALLLLGVKKSAWFAAAVTLCNVAVLCFVVFAGAFLVRAPVLDVQRRVRRVRGIVCAFLCISRLRPGVCPRGRVRFAAARCGRGHSGLARHCHCALHERGAGGVPSHLLGVKAPLAFMFAYNGWDWAAHVVNFGALAAGVGGVFSGLLGQPRIFFAMSQDGLLLPAFGRVHANGTPWVGTLIVGGATAGIAFCSSLDFTASVVSVGILVLFCVVNVALLLSRYGDRQGGTASRRTLLLALLVVVACIVASVLFHAQSPPSITSPLSIVAIVVAAAVVVPVVLLARMPEHPGDAETRALFRCPGVPFVPCAAMAANIFMATSKVCVWCACVAV